MAQRKTIALLTDWYPPAYKAGGPVRSVAALVFHLGDRFNFFVITSNKDAFVTEPLRVKTDEWLNGSYGEKVIYLSDCNSQKIEKVLSGIDYDYLYLNSFFSKPFSIDPLLLRKRGKISKPIVLAPRGMLREGALAIKPLKKKIFIALSKLRGLHDDITWHAASAEEVEGIKKVYGEKAKIVLASNMTLPPLHQRENYAKQPGELKICSVTRLVPNKKIDFAIELLKEVKADKIEYNIYGPAENVAYYERCLALAKGFPAHITVNFKGAVEPNEVESILQNHHVFLLPTETENFGHAIVEAMLNGCVPVISDCTPWRDLEKSGAGWDISLQNGSLFVAILQKMARMNETEFKAQSISTQEFARSKTSDINTLKAYEQLFK